MKIPKVNLKKGFIANVQAIVGDDHFSIQKIDRLSYTRDANFRSAIQAHYGQFKNFPGLIVWPETNEQIAQLIKAAQKYQVAITPYGGGSGVCAGAMSYNGGMVIDVKRMQRLLRVDEDRLYVDVQAGILGLELEKQLNRRGYTLGHFPSSILSASLGGYLAARSAGQLSSKYGKIEDLVIDLQFIDGTGKSHQTSDVSRSKGLDLTQMFVGSEGTLGIVTKARLKIYPYPKDRHYQAYSLSNMSYGIEAMRRIMQTGIKPDVVRLYDPLDTTFVLSSSEPSFSDQLKKSLPQLMQSSMQKIKAGAMGVVFKGHRLVNELARFSWMGCGLVIMLEGEPLIVNEQMHLIDEICRNLNAKDLGPDPAEKWHHHRYGVSYKASKLFLQGAFTDTMEVATTWDNLERLYQGVKSQLKSHCIVLAHISHVYEEGAAIYFTMVAPLNGLKRSLKRYDKLWDTALKAAQEYGGVLSHHHGIGRLKKKLIRKEWGEAHSLFCKLKTQFDPHQILNPGILTEETE